MYIVSVTNTIPSIGAKCRHAEFSNHEDAVNQFNKWCEWLDARDVTEENNVKKAECAFDYIITMTPANEVTNPTDDADYDTRN